MKLAKAVEFLIEVTDSGTPKPSFPMMTIERCLDVSRRAKEMKWRVWVPQLIGLLELNPGLHRVIFQNSAALVEPLVLSGTVPLWVVSVVQVLRHSCYRWVAHTGEETGSWVFSYKSRCQRWGLIWDPSWRSPCCAAPKGLSTPSLLLKCILLFC